LKNKYINRIDKITIVVLVAVYGTLKQGNHNHDVQLARDPVFHGTISLPLRMFSNGRYPMLVHSDDLHDIVLEVYEVNDAELSSLDDLEYPFDYHREQFVIGDYEGVWVYLYTPGTPPEGFRLVQSGDFHKELEW
jgi:gamma-glutamylcyclotransferase (GGCT)/AIG2-like uncharacterized protein YtfP